MSERLVWRLVPEAGLYGLPGRAKARKTTVILTSDDLIENRFGRSWLSALWVSDIREYPTREGKVYCCCAMSTFSRRIVGWSVDTVQDSHRVFNDLDVVISGRTVRTSDIVLADHEVQFTSWASSERAWDAELTSILPIGR